MPEEVRVLIVEDVPSHAELMECELRDAGIAVSVKRVETKEAYLEALSTFLPEVILSDYSLPSFDGIATLQIALKRAPDIPFIFVTGALGEELAIDLLKQGATDYVLKSRLSRLSVAVRRALKEVEERKQRERTQAELKLAGEALRRSEGYLAEAERLSHTGSWAFDVVSDKYVYVSEECFRIYEWDYAHEGLPDREVVSRLIHPEDRDRVSFAHVLREKVDTTDEYKIVLPSGAVKHVQTIKHPVLNSAGDVVRIVGTTMDITERKRAEEKIRQQDIELRQVLDFTPQLVGVFELDRKRIYASRPALDYLGVTLEEWKGKSDPFWLFHPDDRERVQKDIYTGAVSQVPHEFEARLRRKDGAYRWFLFRDNLMRDEQGRITRWYLSATDIEDRKRAEEALRQSEASLAEAQRLSHTGSWAFDLASNRYIYVSEECRRIFELNAQEDFPNREAVSRLIHPEDWDRVNADFEKLLREKVDTSSEFRIVLPSGTVKHIQTTRHPVLNNAGEVITIVGTAIDMTERKKAESEISSLKNYLSNIIDSMPSILVGMDNARTATQWNRQAEAFTGMPAGEAIGKPVADLLPDFAPQIMTMAADMNERRPSSLEKVLIEKEGERRFYDLMLYPLFKGAAEGAVLRIEDVTEKARIQELMVQTEKMMSIGGLAAGMAHEINNPLGIIIQAAQNIERRISLELDPNRKVSEELGLNLEALRLYFDKRQISDAIASIRTASSRAAKIIANMLQFSRRADKTMEFTSLAQIVDRTLELAASDYDLKKNYDFRSIEIIKDYQDTPQVRIVSVEVEQVVLNLLKNAAQAMTANPPDRRPIITLRLRCEDRYTVLEVEDNGPGMTEDIRRRVFEPFFTTKEPAVGTGLGLSVSFMIVTQNHKGLMEVQSTPGRGTVFKVKLPIRGGEQT
ncbi:MAG TPA: PAS domain S-box protein [Thermodesulfobacteriota bacterium]|nr:PAS domain S-box protein [Thermodesulfobacteriota bacterium]